MSFMVSPALSLQHAVLLDSASTDHVANDLDYLTDYHPLNEPEYLLGGGRDIEIRGYGDYQDTHHGWQVFENAWCSILPRYADKSSIIKKANGSRCLL
jgi:hypothetical protein